MSLSVADATSALAALAASTVPDAGAGPAGPPVVVDILESDELERHLQRLDEFEGPGYRRTTVAATLTDGSVVDVEIYEADPEA